MLRGRRRACAGWARSASDGSAGGRERVSRAMEREAAVHVEVLAGAVLTASSIGSPVASSRWAATRAVKRERPSSASSCSPFAPAPRSPRATSASTRGASTVKRTCISAPRFSMTSAVTRMRGDDGSAVSASSRSVGRMPTITRPASGSSAFSGTARRWSAKRRVRSVTVASTRLIVGDPMNAARPCVHRRLLRRLRQSARRAERRDLLRAQQQIHRRGDPDRPRDPAILQEPGRCVGLHPVLHEPAGRADAVEPGRRVSEPDDEAHVVPVVAVAHRADGYLRCPPAASGERARARSYSSVRVHVTVGSSNSSGRSVMPRPGAVGGRIAPPSSSGRPSTKSP